MADELSIVVKTILEVDEAESRQRIEQAKEKLSKPGDTIKLSADIKRQEFQKNVKEAIASAEKSAAKTPFKFGADVKRQELQENLKKAVASAKKSLVANPIKITVGVDEAASLKKIDSYIEAARKKIADAKLNLNINSNLVSGDDAGAATGRNKKRAKSPSWKTNPQNIEGGKKYRDALEESIRANEHIFKDKNMKRSSVSYFISPKDDQIRAIVEYTDGLGKTASMMFTAKKAAEDSGKVLENLQVKQLKVVDSQEKYNQAIEKQNREAEKQKKREESSLNFLNQQENAYKNLRSSAFEQKDKLQGNYAEKAEESLSAYMDEIQRLKDAGDILTGEQRRNLDSLRETAKITIKEQRDAEYGQANLGKKDISSQKSVRQNELNAQIKNLQKLGLYTGEIEAKFENLKATISTIDDFTVFQSWQEEFRVARSEADKLINSLQGLGAKQANNIQGKQIAQIEGFLGQDAIATSDTSGIAKLREQLNALKVSYESVAERFRSSDLNDEEYAKLTAELKRLDTQLRSTANTAKLFDGSLKSEETLGRLGAAKEKLEADFAKMKFDWSKALEIPELRKQIDDIERALEDVDEVNLRDVQNQVKQLQANIRLAKADTKSFGTQIRDLFSKFAQYFSVADLIREAAQAIGKMTENVKALDSAMTEYKKVTDLTEQGYDKFIQSAGKRAIDIGTSIKELVNSTADASRLGFNTVDADSIADASNIYMKVGDDINNIEDATKSIISTMQAFEYEAENAITIVDKFNAAGNNMAISSGGIGAALQKSASALAEANNTLDESIALIAASNRVAQDPASVGQMWKTVSMRLRGAKAELEAAGEDTEGMVESTAQLQELVKGLTGFDILEADQKTFKSTYDIVVGIAKEWENLGDLEQASLLEKLAGKRQGNYFAAALSNMADLTKSMEVTQNSAGSAMTEHERWMQSIEASEARASAAFEQLSDKVMSSDLIKFGYDAQTGILGFLSKLIDFSGSAIPLITTLASGVLSLTNNFGVFTSIKHQDGSFDGIMGSLGLFGRSFKDIGQNRVNNKFIKSFNGFMLQGMTNSDAVKAALDSLKIGDEVSDEIKEAAEAAGKAGLQVQNLGVKATAASVGMKALAFAGNMVVVALASFAISKIVEGIDNYIHRVDILREKVESANESFTKTSEELETVKSELDEVQESIDALESKGAILTFTEEEELDTLRDTNKELMLRNQLLEQQKSIEASKLSGAQMELFNSQFGNKNNQNLQADLNDYESGLRSGMNHIVGLTTTGLEKDNYNYAALMAAYKYNEELKEVVGDSYEDYQDFVEINNEIAEVLNSQLTEAMKIRSTLNSLPKDQVTPEHEAAIEWINQFEQMVWNTIDPTKWMEIQFNDIFNDSQFSAVKDKLIELSEQGNLTKEALKSLSEDVSFNALVDAFSQVGIDIDRVIAEISAKYPQGTDASVTVPSFDAKSSSAFVNSERYNTLIEAMEAQNEAGTISVELYKELIKIDEDLAEMLEATAEGYILNTEALYEYIEAQDDMLRMEVYDAIEKLQEQLNETDLSIDDKNSINTQISEWELLIAEIDNATGALAKWKAASKTANQDSAFNEGESMYDVLKEGNKTGKTGTDDFQSAVDFMLGEDWKSRIGTDFKDLYDAYAQAEKNAKKYFGQEDERTGMKNFANELVDGEFATWGKDAQGRKVLNLAEGLNIEGVAAGLKMSEDAVKSLFKLMEAYGADFEWSFLLSNKDKENLVEYQETIEAIEEVNKRISEEKAGLADLEEGSEEYNAALANIEAYESAAETMTQELKDALSETEETLTLEEALEEISKLQSAIDTLTAVGINVPVTLTGQYDKLQEIITTILGGTETEDGGYTFTVTGLEDAASKLSTIRSVIQFIENNPEIEANLSDGFINDLKEAEKQLANIVDSGEDGKGKAATINVEPNDKVSPEIDNIVNKEYDPIVIDVVPEVDDEEFKKANYEYYFGEEMPIVEDVPYSPTSEEMPIVEDVPYSAEEIEESWNKTFPDAFEVDIVPSEESVDAYFEKITNNTGDEFEDAFPFDSEEIEEEFQKQGEVELPFKIVATEEIITELVNDFIGNVKKAIEINSKKNKEQSTVSDVETVVDRAIFDETISEIESGTTMPITVDRAIFDETISEIESGTTMPIIADINGANATLQEFKNTAAQGVNVPIRAGGGGGVNHPTTYAKGTSGAAGGLSLVDDGKGSNAGPELIEHTSRGTFELGTGNGPRFTMLDKGDVVHTAKETRTILKRLAKVGGFFRNGLNKGKSIIGNAFATGVSGSMVWTDAINTITKSTSANKTSKASNNWKKYLEKLFDWIEVRLERLQTVTDKWILSATNAIGYAAKNENLDKALENTRLQVQETTTAYERYLKQAASVQKKTGLSSSIVKRIQEGTIDISSYSSNTQEKIEAYQEWYEKALSCVDALTELKEQEKELATEKLDNILNHYQWRIDRLDAVIDKMQETIDLKAVTGVEVVESDYTKALEATRKKIEELNVTRETLAEEFKGLVDDGYIQEGSEEWYNYTSELEDLDQTIIETKINLQDLKDAVDQIALTNLDYAISGLEQYAAAIQGMMGLHEAQGTDHKNTDYESLIRNGMEQIHNLEEQNELLKEQQNGLDINSEKYQELQDQISSNSNAILDMKIAQEEWNDAVVDLKIQELQKYQEELQKINDKYQDQKNLQQAIEDLERARSQRTQRVYREGIGFVFESDQEALKSAQDNLESVIHDQLIGKLDELIEALDESKVDTNVYDAAGNLIGTEYVLPEIENLSALLSGSAADSALTGFVSDAKKAIYEQIISGASGQSVSISIGDIVLEGVNDPNALADAIVDQFSNAVTQAIYSKF